MALLNEHEDIAPVILPGAKFGVRHIQTIVMFVVLNIAFSMRVNLSVGIVAMTDASSNSKFPTLDWDTKTKGIILSSFFWGYMIIQIPAGQLAGKFGPKYLLGFALFMGGILTIVIPVAATSVGWGAVLALRALQGLVQSCIYPCVNTFMSKWAPPLERSRLFAFVFSGTHVGTVITMYVAGQLAAGSGGWPSIFYVTGIFAVAWSILWMFVGANSPAEHSSISETEKNYIESALVHSSSNSKSMQVPWREIATSVPMWALLFTNLAENWGAIILLTFMPSYIHSVLGFDIQNNGVLSALPYLASVILTLVFSWIADLINRRAILRLSTARKMWNSIGFWGSGAALLLLATVGKTAESALALLMMSVALNSGGYMGYLTNHLDLAPNFAGVLMGITNGLSCIASILSPVTAGFILTDEKSEYQWRIVFFLSAVVFFLGNGIFILFGSTDVQSWNDPDSNKDERESLLLSSSSGTC